METIDKKSQLKMQVAGAVGALIGYLSFQYIGFALFIPTFFAGISIFLLERKNKGQDKLLQCKNLTASLIIGHSLWIALGTVFILIGRPGLSQEVIISLITVIINFILLIFIFINDVPKNTMLVTAIATLAFLLFNLSALGALGASVFGPFIILHSVIRLGIIAGCIRFVWLMDTQTK